MIPTDFPQSNGVLGPPPGWNEEVNGVCDPLPFERSETGLMSMWTPDSDELARLNAGLPVVLFLMTTSHPVTMVTVAEPMTDAWQWWLNVAAMVRIGCGFER